MKSFPKISCVIVCKDSEKFIAKCLNSIVSQRYESLEIVIIDGGSTDSTLEIISRYENHISFISSENDAGPAQAMNKARAHVTGDLITFLNSDDFKEDGTFNSVGQEFIKTEGAFDIYATGFEVQNAAGKREYQVRRNSSGQLTLKETLFQQFAFNAMFFKTDFFMASNKFFETFSDGKTFFACDRLWVAEAILKNRSCRFVDGPKHVYVKHQGSATFNGNNWIKTKSECIFVAEKLRRSDNISQQQLDVINKFYFHSLSLLILVSFIEWKPRLLKDSLSAAFRVGGIFTIQRIVIHICSAVIYRLKRRLNYCN